MTPAIRLAKKHKIAHRLHEYQQDPRAASYGLEAASLLNQDPNQVFKTLLFCLNGDSKQLAVAIIPCAQKLNLKLAAKAAKAKKAEMAEPAIAEKTTGYVLGGISPLGQKKALPTFLDESATQYPSIFVSGGKRGLEIELSPQDLLSLTKGQFAALCLSAEAF